MADPFHVEMLLSGADNWNQWRANNPRIMPDLTYTDLSKKKFEGYKFGPALFNSSNFSKSIFTDCLFINSAFDNTNFSNTEFLDTTLFEVTCSHTIFFHTKIQKSSFTRAIFEMVDFSSAQISSSDFLFSLVSQSSFRNCYLGNVKFKKCRLINSDFSRSNFGDIFFLYTEMRDLTGLDNIYFLSSCYIDNISIKENSMTFPNSFLWGCNFNDIDIEYQKLKMLNLTTEQVNSVLYKIFEYYYGKPIQYYSVFICFSSKDMIFAQKLYDELRIRKISCWFSPQDMEIGSHLRKTIGEQIRVHDKLLIILSKNALESEWVEDEVEKAIEEEKKFGVQKLFPIFIDDSVFDYYDNWSEKIRLQRHIGDFTSWQSPIEFGEKVIKLIDDLHKT